ncbi:MAG: hypothetical protein AAF628_10425 [Planctomycetota bacterium]
MSGPRALLVALAVAAVVLAIGVPMLLSSRATEAATLATSEDAQDFDQLWRELESLQGAAASLPTGELKRRIVQRTLAYLRLEGDAAARFVSGVDAALDDLSAAGSRMQQANVEVSRAEDPTSVRARRDAWSRWQQEQRDASDRLLEVLEARPRHRLLIDQRLLWLLRLDYAAQPGRDGDH